MTHPMIKSLAADYATRIGWRHKSSPDARLCHEPDIAKALLAFHEEAKQHTGEQHQAEQQVDHTRVNIPVSENEAVLMAAMGTDWLERNAPHRLKQAEPVDLEVCKKAVQRLDNTIFKNTPENAIIIAQYVLSAANVKWKE